MFAAEERGIKIADFSYFLYLVRCSWGHIWTGGLIRLPVVSIKLLLRDVDCSDKVINDFDGSITFSAVPFFLADLDSVDE